MSGLEGLMSGCGSKADSSELEKSAHLTGYTATQRLHGLSP